MSRADAFVTLASGVIVPVAAVLLALDLERRGIKLRVDAGGLAAGPSDRLTHEDRVAIRHWRLHLTAIAAVEGERAPTD